MIYYVANFLKVLTNKVYNKLETLMAVSWNFMYRSSFFMNDDSVNDASGCSESRDPSQGVWCKSQFY
jgi:hypothetical protein